MEEIIHLILNQNCFWTKEGLEIDLPAEYTFFEGQEVIVTIQDKEVLTNGI
jgi:hypothetical protein